LNIKNEISILFVVWHVNNVHLDASGTRVQFLAEAREFSLLHSIKSGSGAHPGSCPMDNCGSFPRCKVTRIMKLTTHLHLVPGIRILAAVPPLLIHIYGVVLK
jgi:hypothetical protein